MSRWLTQNRHSLFSINGELFLFPAERQFNKANSVDTEVTVLDNKLKSTICADPENFSRGGPILTTFCF